MKLAIVVGHNAHAQGAVRIIDGATEFVWNSDLAQMIRACDPGSVRVFHRDHRFGRYSTEIRAVYAQVDAWGADLSVELHFNGSPNPRAEGCLTLSSGTRGSLILARAVHPLMQEVMGNQDDGIEIRSRSMRGGLSLWAGRAPAIMAEPYFGGNARFCHVADTRMDQLAEAIFEGAVDAADALAPA